MADERPSRPTDAELEILRILQERGPSTVREIQDALTPDGGVSATSVLKLLQIMQGKGLASRDASSRAHVFSARVDRDTLESELTTQLLDRVFDGSAARLALRALASRPSSAEELEEIERLIASYRKKEERR